MKVALVTGITGQTGSYLAELLLGKGYAVHGIIRRSSSFNTGRIDHLLRDPQLRLHYGDVCDPLSIRRVLGSVNPQEVYNLAAQSHVKVSFDQPCYSVETVAPGALHMLEAVRDHREATGSDVRYYQASSSEMFGSAMPPQSETTPFHPRSPYACAKVYAYHQTINYREAYGLHASNGILFNHESPRRGETFVTRKITRAAGRIYYGLQDKLNLGNLEAKRDWGFAGDYADAIWRIVQQLKPDDYVVATGTAMSVQAWLELVFSAIGRDWQDHVVVDERYMRPAEVNHLCGDPSKVMKATGWKPTVSAVKLCDMMLCHDLALAAQEANQKSFTESYRIPVEIARNIESMDSPFRNPDKLHRPPRPSKKGGLTSKKWKRKVAE